MNAGPMITVRAGGPVHAGGRVLAVVICAVIALGIPQYYPAFRVDQFSDALAIAVAALGLNLLIGYAGMLSVGHSAFFGIGAYATSLLTDPEVGWSHWQAAAAGVGIAFVAGLLCGLPALRIKGPYLALATLALAAVFPQLLVRFTDVTGGSQGNRSPRVQLPAWAEDSLGLATDQYRYYLTLVAAAIVVLLLRNLVHGRVGRALVASRDHELAARSVGVNLAAYRITAFGLSAAITAFGGTLFVMQTGFVSSTDSRFTLLGSLMLVVAVILGGTGTVAGPVLGAVAVVFLPPLLSELSGTLSQVLLGVGLIAFMYAAPGGVVGLYRAVGTRLVMVVPADSPAAGRGPQRHVHPAASVPVPDVSSGDAAKATTGSNR